MRKMQLDEVCGQLADRYGEKGQPAAERLRLWMSGDVPFADSDCLAQHFCEEQIPLLFDAFWRDLPFGTGGRRGRVGYGANRFNKSTLATTVQGHCNYLRAVYGEKEALGVVIANDIREFNDVAGTYRFLSADHPLIGLSSYKMARFAAQIYAANGVIAYLPPFAPELSAKVLNTPELAYVIGRMKEVVGGINLSASHNPPDDNGIKVYDSQGSQPVAPDDEHLMQTMIRVRKVQCLDFDEARQKELIREFSSQYHADYLQIYLDRRGTTKPIDRRVPIVYTPLCGGGESTAGELLQKAGFSVFVPPDQRPDGSFASIPFRIANPEVFAATGPARAFAEGKGASIVLSSDPDADRIGVEIRLPDGRWHHCDGNQIAAILAYYLMVDPEGPRRQGLLIETLVTTKLLGKIVEAAGNSWLIDDLLVGFKYVADVLKRLGRGEPYGEIRCRPDQLVLAVEESHGVITSPQILDKDSSPACLYIAELHLRLQQQGRNLLDYYVDILGRFGDFDNVNRSLMMNGADGVVRKQKIMDWLRSTPPQSIAGCKVHRVLDYWDESSFGPFQGDADRSSRDVVQLQCDGLVVTVRPSGTEAKLKLYVQLLPSTRESSHGDPSSSQSVAKQDPSTGVPVPVQGRFEGLRTRAEAVAGEVYNVLLQPLNQRLEGPGLMLSDVIDLDLKLEFESKTLPALRSMLQQQPEIDLERLLNWLKKECQTMTPGSDPSMAIKAAIDHACKIWKNELSGSSVLDQLAAWARD